MSAWRGVKLAGSTGENCPELPRTGNGKQGKGGVGLQGGTPMSWSMAPKSNPRTATFDAEPATMAYCAGAQVRRLNGTQLGRPAGEFKKFSCVCVSDNGAGKNGNWVGCAKPKLSVPISVKPLSWRRVSSY